MTLLFALACTPDSSVDSSSGDTSDAASDTASDTAETGGDPDSGDTADTADTNSGAPTYANDVFPVYATTCSDCHHDWGGPDDPDRVYAALIDTNREPQPIVVPGDREGSWMYDKLAHAKPRDGKEQMPPVCTHLEAAEIADLAAWIDAGAANDATWATFYQFSWMGRHCHNCHEDWGGMDASAVLTYLTTHTESDMPLIKPGDSAASLLYLKVSSDYPPFGDRMPLEFAKLDADVVEAIGLWIDSGAPNN